MSWKVLNNKLFVHYSSHDLNNKTFKEQTILDHLNTKLVRYSGPHVTQVADVKWAFTGPLSSVAPRP